VCFRPGHMQERGVLCSERICPNCGVL
jgi:hypothetical protein